MIFKTYFDKDNVIIKGSELNTGLNPISELYHGGPINNTIYSRLIFWFDEAKLKSMVQDKTYAQVGKLKHVIKMKNTICYGEQFLNGETCDGKKRACSFDLVLFPLPQKFDEGVGYDYIECTDTVNGCTSVSYCASNWFESATGSGWTQTGVYSGSPTVYATQHFDHGNEDLEMDITPYINDILTGTTVNNGFGIAFSHPIELTGTDELEYVGFFSKQTQSYYEPYLETTYDMVIQDDRANFFMDKLNKLYFYTNLGNTPVNLDVLPTVTILDNNGDPFLTGLTVTQETKGVYSVEFSVPSTAATDCMMFQDVWSNIVINGINRPDVEMEFVLADPMNYFNFGNADALPKSFGFSISGIKRDEKIKRGDIKKVLVSARVPYTVDKKEVVDGLQYRLYVKEGPAEVNVIDWSDVHRTFNNNYFLLDTSWMIPNKYFLDIKAESNQEITTYKEIVTFSIVNQVDC